MRQKRSVFALLAVLVLFVIANYVIWKSCTQDLITADHYDGGDLVRMSYIRDSKLFRHNHVDLPRQHIPLKEYKGQRVEMITIGDSFSQGGGGGKNRYYQDYIASRNGFDVLNLEHYRDIDFITTISLFLNNGFIERVNPRYVLIGAVERGMDRLAREIDFTRVIDERTLRRSPLYPHEPHPKSPHFINNGHFKMFVNTAFYSFSDHAPFANVYTADLTRDFFSVKNSSKLLYIPLETKFTEADVRKLNDNMNTLADRLNAKGIRLVYMPYVDKYTLYYKWLVKKRYPESQFFEMLRPLPKRYEFIDTKALLREGLEKGAKDVFYPDDAHSSRRASEIIFDHINFRTH